MDISRMAPGTPLRFAFSRGHGGKDLKDGARLFIELLKARTGLQVSLVVAYDYRALLERFRAGHIELAWMPPLIQAQACDGEGELVAVCERAGGASYRAALLVHAASHHHTVADLRGGRAAWTDPGSASGYVFPRLYLAAAGLDPAHDLEEAIHGSTALACAAVARGDADVSACFLSDAAARDPARRAPELSRSLGTTFERLRVLAVTDPIPADGLVLSPRVAGPDAARLRTILCSLHDDAEGRRALGTLLQAERLTAPTQELGRLLRRLRAQLGRERA
jgi:phosphonate transport system substrate-binding protein